MVVRLRFGIVLGLLTACQERADIPAPPYDDTYEAPVTGQDPAMRSDAGTAQDADAEADAGAVSSTTPLDSGSLTDAAIETDATSEPDGSESNPDCAELTYKSFGEAFMDTWCLKCHITVQPQLDTHEAVKAHILEIRAEAVDSKRMPAGSNVDLSDAERAKLGRWLSCGAP